MSERNRRERRGRASTLDGRGVGNIKKEGKENGWKKIDIEGEATLLSPCHYSFVIIYLYKCFFL